jgi:subfamily B ATP-binding cassette protein HlyB/CyaB
MENPRLLTKESFVWILGSLCRLHRIPFDAGLLLRRHPPDENGGYDAADLARAADELGFRTGTVRTARIDDFASLTLPCLAFLCPAGSERKSTDQDFRIVPALITGADGDDLFFHEAGEQAPKRCARAEFSERFEPVVHLFTPKPEAVRDEDGARALSEKPFGFGWFVPEILKHRRVWRDVLAASLALQLVGLATPLFTQAVIDKVVVHQTESTLVAVAVGMVLSIVFSALFTWVRQYLVLHTGNRIDAVLGSRVFAHLLQLPMPYFAHRPTGTLVARLQGVESIREFLSGSPPVSIPGRSPTPTTPRRIPWSSCRGSRCWWSGRSWSWTTTVSPSACWSPSRCSPAACPSRCCGWSACIRNSSRPALP